MPNAVKWAPVAQTKVIPFKSWCNVSLAAPSSNLSLNASGLNVESDKDSSFDGTTIAFKAIFNFERVVTAFNSFLLFGSWVNDAGISGGQLTTAVAVDAVIQCLLRVRPITASFTTSTLTWNNVVVSPSLTIGADLFNGALLLSEFFLATGTNTNFYMALNDYGGQTTAGLTMDVLGTVYGFIVDMQAITQTSLGGALTHSYPTTPNFNMNTPGLTGIKPCLVLP